MNFEQISSNKLEFNKIIAMLRDFAIIPTVKDKINNLLPSDNIDTLKLELEKTKEAHMVIVRSARAPILISSNFKEIITLLSKHAILDGLQLYEVTRLYSTIKANIKYLSMLNKDQIETVYYKKQVEDLYYNEKLDGKLEKTVDETGYILDDASSNLRSIRKKILLIEVNIKQKLQELINKESSKLTSTSVVLRDDRFCIAVKAEYKNQIKGIIHDVSASSSTVFIEPIVASQLMSDKMRLLEDEKEEINKILKEISTELYYELDNLKQSFDIICDIDFIFSKGLLAKSYDGTMPNLNSEGILDLVKARHPLLKVKKVIPNSVSFGNGYLGIIITGPNTGGKTVLLKTIGLLCTMVKYGLLIPAEEESNIMIFDKILCDIGDDQSIETNLSTFSSHMNNITSIINTITPKSLVLFDEIGAGTDPIEGSNLAKAILKYLISNRVSFITTTHYSELKAFGFESSEVMNASMEFDQNTLSPTYRLLIGVSGSSNAFNIAKRLGLKEEIIKDAKNMTIKSNDDTRKLIHKLECQSKDLEKLKNECSDLKKELNLSINDYNTKIKELEKNKAKIIKDAQKEADEFVEKVSKEALDLLENTKKLQKSDTKLHELIDAKHKVDNLSKKIDIPKKDDVVENVELKVGDDVFIEEYGQYGSISNITKNGLYEVAIGNISLKLSRNELKKVKSVKLSKREESKLSYNKSRANVSMTLDLRGKRYEEAKEMLDKYVDDLIVVGIKQASIIHGFGTGVIRELVQSFVKKNKNIASFRYGGENEGGFGVTIITLK